MSTVNRPIKLILGFHNHQPVGNFDGIFDQNFQLAYQPLIETFARFPSVKFSLHLSGPLWEWIERNQPKYLDQIEAMMSKGQLELLAGAWSEPIMPMIPRRDRIGQIHYFRDRIQQRFGIVPKGLWLAERVWEPDLVESLARSGIEYTVLDDYHFHRAGLDPDSLGGYYLTEDQGYLLKLFPNSEPLRYLVPWKEPEETIAFLKSQHEAHPTGMLAVTADDGEKFGGWPGTHDLIYKEGWLARFLTLLSENSDWIETVTFSEAMDQTQPLGKIYLPPASYREMTEWVLFPDRLSIYQEASANLQKADPEFAKPILEFFAPGGFWRNFQVKYPESSEMAAHMRNISQLVGRVEHALKARAGQGEESSERMAHLQTARQELYRSQCNCAYWHGAFGGLYLPHLRNAVYRHLILAENAIDQIIAPDSEFIRALQNDFNADLHDEIKIDNHYLAVWISPSQGGQIYELDDRRTATNLLATLNRRPEPYHEPVRKAAQAPPTDSPEGPSNLHDRITLKHEGLDQLLVYDRHPRKALVDHLWASDTTPQCVMRGEEIEIAPWPTAKYEIVQLEKAMDHVTVHLRQSFLWDSAPLEIIKRITVSRSDSLIEVEYELNGLQGKPKTSLAVEINIAGMAGHEPDRQFRDGHGKELGYLDSCLNLDHPETLMLSDQWLDLGTRIDWSNHKPDRVWTMPIRTVSNSEGGFEAIFQSTAMFVIWDVGGSDENTFQTRFHWRLCPSHRGC